MNTCSNKKKSCLGENVKTRRKYFFIMLIIKSTHYNNDVLTLVSTSYNVNSFLLGIDYLFHLI